MQRPAAKKRTTALPFAAMTGFADATNSKRPAAYAPANATMRPGWHGIGIGCRKKSRVGSGY